MLHTVMPQLDLDLLKWPGLSDPKAMPQRAPDVQLNFAAHLKEVSVCIEYRR